MDVILFIGPSVIDEKLSYLLSCLQREPKTRFEPFQNREVILQVFFFSSQGAKDMANLPVQVDNHNNAKDLH